jgi:nucleoside-diphosphate kinase
MTFGMIKPDAVAAGHAGAIMAIAEKAGFRIAGLKMVRLRIPQAESFYAVHRGKPFFEELVAFITEGPVIAMALEADNAISRWREVMGATDPAKAAEGTIRKLYGTNISRNAVHGSDAPETAAIEVPFFFSASELI